MPLSHLSIKQKLFITVAIIALPALWILVSSGLHQRDEAILQAKLETQKLAETIVSEQKIIIASTRQLFIALSQVPEITSHNQAETRSILTEILRQSPQYSNIFVADPSGEVWASAVPLTEPVNVADRRYLKNALSTGKLSSGEFHIARTSKKPTLNLGYPLFDKAGKVTSVLCVGLSLEHYRHIFNAYKLPKGASYALLDHKGIILTRAIEPEKHIGKQADLEIFKHMLEGPDEETSIGKSSVAGDERVQTYRKLRLAGESTPYLYIRAGIPTDVVMAEAHAALARNLITYSFFLLAAFLLSWFTGKRYITDKVILLQRSSQRLAEGALDTRVAHEVGGGELGQLGQAFDDMARKLSLREQALRESESNYRDIFNATHDALIVNDGAGRIIEANRSSETIFGYTREELLNLSVEDLVSGEHPYGIEEALILMEKSLSGGTQTFEWLNKRKSGKIFWSEITITPISIVGVKRVLAVIRDITDRKEVELMKEALLSSISHEMRTPLTAMLGFLEFVTENPVEAEQLKEYHAIMLKEAERLNELITNFLDMQRLKAKLQTYDFQPLDVRAQLEEAAAIFANPATRQVIAYDLPEELPPILGDAVLLHQLFTNLISNAIKYSPEGSRVVLGATRDDTTVTVTVTDEGMGIPAEAVDKIFDLFYRLDDASTRHITGTGLGLALVKEIADAHSGKVWAESILGKGSTFYVMLPMYRTANAGDAPMQIGQAG